MRSEQPSDEAHFEATGDDPFAVFGQWLTAAEAAGLEDPNAMVVSTVDTTGQPSARAVLLKDFDAEGFVFYTNLGSRKGRDIDGNPKVSLHFFWRELHRQILILGTAHGVTDEEADAYFSSRPRTSQLGAWASRQSRPLRSRSHLLAQVARYQAQFGLGAVPRPPFWSGFCVAPHAFEFWQAGRFRLHERWAYAPDGDGGWHKQRLNP
ncbi:MAG: pyridoxamine 5'-phosphate oxidase [Acidobacteriota bacterium]